MDLVCLLKNDWVALNDLDLFSESRGTTAFNVSWGQRFLWVFSPWLSWGTTVLRQD